MHPKWRCISYLKNRDLPASYVSLPEGNLLNDPGHSTHAVKRIQQATLRSLTDAAQIHTPSKSAVVLRRAQRQAEALKALFPGAIFLLGEMWLDMLGNPYYCTKRRDYIVEFWKQELWDRVYPPFSSGFEMLGLLTPFS